MKTQSLTRVAAVVALLVAVIAVAALTQSGSSGYQVKAEFADVGALVSGFRVRIDGAPVGTVSGMQLESNDHVLVTMNIDNSAAPVGTDATATVRAADLLGEKYIDLVPGNRNDPAPSGYTIQLSHTGLAVELDDVLNAIDLPTQQALRAFLTEAGTAFGDPNTLAATLAALPPSLDQTKQLLSQLGQSNATLGRLVDQSSRVIAAVNTQRPQLQSLVTSAAGTLGILAARKAELGQTVATAPAAISSLHNALAALESAAIPLGPAAQGLAATAPQLTATLEQLPAFSAAASPTLAAVRDVAPTLQQLGVEGTPVVRRLPSLTSNLAGFATTLQPVTNTLDKGVGNLLGFMEGWARATQARDSASHVFRFGLTVSPATFSSLAPLFSTKAKATKPAALQQAVAKVLAAPPAPAPAPIVTALPKALLAPVTTLLKSLVPKLTGTVKNLTSTLTKATSTVTSSVVKTVTQTLQQLGLATPPPASGSSGSGQSNSLSALLNYLLR
jgi:phospholipid/cholesterol/gamma-HCH transport system substrate-binding protein